MRQLNTAYTSFFRPEKETGEFVSSSQAWLQLVNLNQWPHLFGAILTKIIKYRKMKH